MWYPTSPTDAFWLFNVFTGANHYLSIDTTSVSDVILNIPEGNTNPVTWTWAPDAQFPTFGNLCRTTQPVLCLDVYGTDNTQVHLVDPAKNPGQRWTRELVSDGTWRFSNNATGNGMFLDVFSDTKQAFMATPDKSGQHWTFYQAPVTKNAASSLAIISAALTSVKALQTGGGLAPATPDGTYALAPVRTAANFVVGNTALQSATDSASPQTATAAVSMAANNVALSTTAAAGIAVGVSAPILVLVTFLAILFFRRRANARAQGQATIPPRIPYRPDSFSPLPYHKNEPASATSDASTSIWGGSSPISAHPNGLSRAVTRSTTTVSRYVPVLFAPHNTADSHSMGPQLLDSRPVGKPKSLHELPG
ncbi:MAG: hypothetical protein M1814_004473 [Vezdaea aestivalis]|nr:MAG: hypothetical protein M1814_004473 [Vezdaea aestivalis]